MKIIILGAGQVGATLAEHLSKENNDITIIDTDEEKLKNLQERIDVLTILGNGAHPNILKRSGAEEADIIIAVTKSDETNLVACQVANTLFQIPTKIARIRSMQYLDHEELFGSNAFPIDVLISPEQLVTNYICRLIEHPNALQVLDFADKKIQLVALKASANARLVGHPLKTFNQIMPSIDTRIVALFHKGKAIFPKGSTIINPEDEVFFLAAKEHTRQVMAELTHMDHPYKRIMIAGGGNIGTRLALSLEQQFQVKIIERTAAHAELLAEQLSNTVVLRGDACDKELLQNENIESMDIFCAVTNQDETNIMSAILAKRLGAHKVMALINRTSYLDLIEGGEVDIVISPQLITISSLLTHVRRGDIVDIHSIHGGSAEAIEAIAHGNKVVGQALKNIALPTGAMIGAIVRDEEVIMGHRDVVIKENDHVILFLFDRSKIRQIDRLFQEEKKLFI